MQNGLTSNIINTRLSLNFSEELTLYTISKLQTTIEIINLNEIKSITMDLDSVDFVDTAGAIFLLKMQEYFRSKSIDISILCTNTKILSTLKLVEENWIKKEVTSPTTITYIDKINDFISSYILGFYSFMEFFGKLFMTKIYYLKSFKNIRFKEIAFEINESAIKAVGIISLTSFLIGLVIAYQSAYQLKIYGANIFIVDMIGISVLRELAPLMTAIVIAGRSGSAFTAQIGAMKITQELDAMKTMGFDPFSFLVLPRVIALIIAMPILIFIADIMGVLGGMFVANIDLEISTQLFLDRFSEVVAVKHFFIGLLKGPFFAFLIASISIYRGLVVKDDTQSIGFNTTKSVVESIFAVIVCDALFSIAFTTLGI